MLVLLSGPWESSARSCSKKKNEQKKFEFENLAKRKKMLFERVEMSYAARQRIGRAQGIAGANEQLFGDRWRWGMFFFPTSSAGGRGGSVAGERAVGGVDVASIEIVFPRRQKCVGRVSETEKKNGSQNEIFKK